MSETVLVTGGSGYVAGWCIAELLTRGYVVRATLRSPDKESAVRAAVAAASGNTAATGSRATGSGATGSGATASRATGSPDADSPATHAASSGSSGRLNFAVADLTKDDGWDAAVAGCDYVLHIASPLGADGHASDLVGPAREGTLRVLRAAADAGVKRVVLTSSTGACTPVGPAGAKVADETVWTDADNAEVNTYRRSKTLAERAAWQFIEQNPGPMTLTSVLPAAVFGPVIGTSAPGTAEVLQRLLSGQFPGIPRLGFSVIDARDLADLHIQAMTAGQAGGERFVAAGEFLWLADIAQILRSRLGQRAARIPKRRMPSPLLRGLAWFVPTLRPLTPLLDRELAFSSAKAQRVLGFTPRPVADTITDSATSVLEPVSSPPTLA